MGDIVKNKTIAAKRSALIKYIRINGYRIFFGVSALLFGSTFLFAFIGYHFNITMIVSAMVFILIALFIAAIFGVTFIEMFVVRLKRCNDHQVERTFEKLISIKKNTKY